MPSSTKDQFKIEVRKEDLPIMKAARFFIDDISVKKMAK